MEEDFEASIDSSNLANFGTNNCLIVFDHDIGHLYSSPFWSVGRSIDRCIESESIKPFLLLA